MKTKPPILWRWKGHGKWTEGIVQQEMNDLIKISDEWYLKQDIDTRALWEMDAKRDEEGMAKSIYPVKCCCGWFGMSDDCRRNLCPNCGLRVTREFNEEEGKR